MKPNPSALFALFGIAGIAFFAPLSSTALADGEPSGSALNMNVSGTTPQEGKQGAEFPKIDDHTLQEVHAVGHQTRCEACHTEGGWLPARFAHERTGFQLLGQHTRAQCRACHIDGYERPAPSSCAGCHTDVHAQEFGMTCVGCHDENGWKAKFDVLAHRSTNFPLSGRHAFLPCEECHRNARDRGYTRSAATCSACHLGEYQTAGARNIDHLRSGFSTDCKSCHQPTNFRPARFLRHETCFPLLSGPHRSIGCADCHFSVAGTAATENCQTNNTGCINCHAHTCEAMAPVHENVGAFGCSSPRCVGCHVR